MCACKSCIFIERDARAQHHQRDTHTGWMIVLCRYTIHTFGSLTVTSHTKVQPQRGSSALCAAWNSSSSNCAMELERERGNLILLLWISYCILKLLQVQKMCVCALLQGFVNSLGYYICRYYTGWYLRKRFLRWLCENWSWLNAYHGMMKLSSHDQAKQL